jgi:GTPase SAR1 family protein
MYVRITSMCEMLTQSRKILLFGLPVVGKTTICQWLVKGLTDIREAHKV